MVEPSDAHLNPDSQWSTYEANVQAYRSLSIASQSLYLAVGAILLGFGFRIPFFAVLLMAMITAWYVFFPVIFARTAIVDFHKFDLGGRFTTSGTPRTDPGEPALSERQYAAVLAGRGVRATVASYIEMPRGERFRTLRTTRFKLDVVLPGLVSVVWLIFAVYILIVG